MKGDAKRTFLRWHGPGVVLGHEADGETTEGNYCVAFRGGLYRVSQQLMRMATDEERLSQKVFTETIAEWKDKLPGGGGEAQVRYIDVLGQNEDGAARPAARRTTMPVARTPPPRQEPDAEQGPKSPVAGVSEEDEEILLPQDLESATQNPAAGDIDMREAIEQPVPEDDPFDVLELRNKENKAGAKGKELDPRYFNDEEWRIFRLSDSENWKSHLHHGAVRVVLQKEAKEVDPSGVLPIPSRYVRVNKSKEADFIEAKSRWIVPGHLDPDKELALGQEDEQMLR